MRLGQIAAARWCLMVAIAVGSVSVVSLAGQTSNTPSKAGTAKTSTAKTPWGDPDLQGTWDFRSATPLERPSELAGKDVLNEEEAAEFAEKTIKSRNRDTNVPAGNVGDYNDFWYDYGRNVVGTKRSSLIVDPADGKIPPLTPDAQKRIDAVAEARKGTQTHEPTPGGWVEDLGLNALQVRCIVGFNSGPPMAPSAYNNNVQIVQAPGYVALVNEMNHNTRFVPLDGRPHGSARRWVGVSRGRWEGQTLVVETKNFLGRTAFDRGRTDSNLRLIERFTRSEAGTMLYEYTVDDPTVYSRPWTAQTTMSKSDEYMYEYACHEGNMGLVNILAGARAQEKKAGSKP